MTQKAYLHKKPFVRRKRIIAVVVVLTLLLFYFITTNMGTQTIKQRLLQLAYPVLMRFTKLAGANATVLHNKNNKPPAQPFYNLNIVLNNGKSVSLDAYKGKKVLLVNTASNCGYTGQYEELQQLWEQHKEELVIIGFPANDFKEQEKDEDEAIAQFCKINYGVQFPLAKKSSVVKGPQQNSVFAWLSSPQQNGWNDHAPDWKFSKYLINEQGVLTHYFGPSITPLGKEVQEALQQQ
jgi:glutathione peroxidase